MIARLVCFCAVLAASAPVFAQSPIGEFELTEGDVRLKAAAQPDAVLSPKTGTDVAQDDTVTTLTKARARLRFLDESTVSLGENTRLRLTRMVYDPDRGRDGDAALDAGLALFHIRPQTSLLSQVFRVLTPFGTIQVKGTSFFVEVTSERATVTVFSGEVVLEGAGGSQVSIRPGERASIDASGIPSTPEPAPPGSEGSLSTQVSVSLSLPGLLRAPAPLLETALGLVPTQALGTVLSTTAKLPAKVLQTTPRVVGSVLGAQGALRQASLPGVIGALPGVLGAVVPVENVAGLAQVTGTVVLIP